MTAFNSLCTAHTTTCSTVLVLLLASCTSPPKPPTVDDSNKRPVNTKASLELQSCRGELSRAHIALAEVVRPTPLVTGAENAQNDGMRDAGVRTARPVGEGNHVVVVPFKLGSVAWGISQADADELARRASAASFVMIRGRTDSTGDSLRETALARRRAEVAAAFLAAAGTPADKMRLTWQGAGDGLPGTSGRDRAQNRRVEIEFYTATPSVDSVRNDLKTPPDARRSDTAASL